MEQNYIIIDVSTKKHPVQFALIDAEDVKRVATRKWGVDIGNRLARTKPIYVFAGIKGKRTRLHRFIMNAKEGQIVDHINGNTMDNRKANLRFVTHQQSQWNRTKFNPQCQWGVWYVKNKKSKPYRVRIVENGRQKHLGYFATEKEAHDVYEKEAKRIKGEYKRKEE